MVKWTGIKRCGGAMHKGGLAAINIHQRMKQLTFGTEPEYKTLEPVPPMIAIALGDDALAYRNGGEIQSGDDVHSRFFEDDVGFNSESCLSRLRLTTAFALT